MKRTQPPPVCADPAQLYITADKINDVGRLKYLLDSFFRNAGHREM